MQCNNRYNGCAVHANFHSANIECTIYKIDRYRYTFETHLLRRIMNINSYFAYICGQFFKWQKKKKYIQINPAISVCDCHRSAIVASLKTDEIYQSLQQSTLGGLKTYPEISSHSYTATQSEVRTTYMFTDYICITVFINGIRCAPRCVLSSKFC